MIRVMWVMQSCAPSGLARSRLSIKLAPSSRYFSTLYQLTLSTTWLYILYIARLPVIISPTLFGLNTLYCILDAIIYQPARVWFQTATVSLYAWNREITLDRVQYLLATALNLDLICDLSQLSSHLL